MRLSEFIMIYLATAAPFGVAYFLSSHTDARNRPRSLARAAVAALLWPLTAFVLFKASGGERPRDTTDHFFDEERSVERAKRSLVNSLRDMEDVLELAHGPLGKTERHTLFVAREAVERYVGLVLAARDVDANAAPTAREMELCRIAGQTGEDLLNAGRCIHRRNVTRLLAHRERARDEFIHALAKTREMVNGYQKNPLPDAVACHGISEALIQSFSRAIELHSLLEDRAAALRVARLHDAECAQLRRLEAKAAAFSTQAKSPSPAFSLPTTDGLKAGL